MRYAALEKEEVCPMVLDHYIFHYLLAYWNSTPGNEAEQRQERVDKMP